jgi:hypothetical protein
MNRSGKVTLIASLIGSAVGLWAWGLNLTRLIWPAHPQWAAFFLTIVATIAVQLFWPTAKSKT